jgi:hypothetical protein
MKKRRHLIPKTHQIIPGKIQCESFFCKEREEEGEKRELE